MKIIIERPDQIYHVWHYCPICGKTFSHSQGTWDWYRGEHCGVNWKDVPAAAKTVEIEITGKAQNEKR